MRQNNSRIDDMSRDIQDQLIDRIKVSGGFSIQLDESTDVVTFHSFVFMFFFVFVKYIHDGKILDDFLFCRGLTNRTTVHDVLKVVSEFFPTEGLSWENVIGICDDGATAMLCSRSGFFKLAKKHKANIVGIHCMIHRQALASETLLDPLCVHQRTVINIVNFVKGSSLNTRLFRNVCKEMDAIHDSLLYYTQVRWLSRGNVMIRFHDLLGEIQSFLENQRKDLLLAKTK